MNKADRYTPRELQDIVNDCYSVRQFAKALGYAPDSPSSAKDIIKEYNLDISHFKGQGWSKNKIDLSIFQYNKSQKSSVMIRALTIMRGWRCEKCGRTEWEGQKIPLCVHHIDGNHINNELDNLQLLCPNCHAQTDNYCGRNKSRNKKVTDEELIEALKTTTSIRQALQKVGINYSAKYYYDKAHRLIEENGIIQKPKKKIRLKQKTKTEKEKEPNRCIDCGETIDNRAHRCEECEHKRQRRVEWPQRDELKELIRNKPFTAIGRQFNVTDNTIRKWCKHYKLPFKKTEIKQYSDEEWLTI